MSRTARRFGLVVLLLLAVGGAALASGLGEDERRAEGGNADAQVSPGQPPELFANTLNAHGVGDGQALWLSVTGQLENGQIQLRVLKTTGGAWKEEPSVDHLLDSGSPHSLVLLDGRPCLGGTGEEGSFASCRSDEGWTDLGPEALRGLELLQLLVIGGQLHALVRSPSTHHLRFLRWSSGEWTRSGPRLPVTQGIVRAAPTAAVPTVAVVAMGRRPVRAVYRLVSNEWRRTGRPFRDAHYGPFPGTPVEDGGEIVVPVTDATKSPWSFRVYAVSGDGWRDLEVGSAPTSRGGAQGSVGGASGNLWAIWQENEPAGGPSFNSKVWSQRVDAPESPPVLLWEGRSLGPSDAEVFDGLGGTWALYMPGGMDGLKVRLKRLPG